MWSVYFSVSRWNWTFVNRKSHQLLPSQKPRDVKESMFTMFTMFRSRDREDRTTLDELFIGYRLKSLPSGRPRRPKLVELCICLFQLLREAIKLPHKPAFLA